jgi:hypothetical protein
MEDIMEDPIINDVRREKLAREAKITTYLSFLIM